MHRHPLPAGLSRLGAVSAALLTAVGLGGALSVVAPSSAGAVVPTPMMYVGNVGNHSITSYPLPTTGDTAPTTTITGGGVAPYKVAFDAAGDLWSSNYVAGTLTEYTPTQLATGGTPTPAVTLSSTGPSIDGPTGIAFDHSGDLWLANYSGSTISMFTPAQIVASGTPTPTVMFTATAGGLDNADSLAFDAAGDLWAASTNDSTLDEYTPAQLTQSGAITPAVVITGNAGSILVPFSLTFDPAGDAWVANQGNATVTEFTPAMLAASGTPAPAVTIHNDGANDLTEAEGLEFDSAGTLWVTNFVSSVSGLSAPQLAASGTPTPTYVLTGGSTNLDSTSGLALADPPQAPAGLTASASGGTVTLSWLPDLGSVAATDYQVTPSINGVTQPTIDTHSTSTTLTYGGVGGGTFAFSVSASNVFGTGPKAISNSVTVAPGYWQVASDGGIFAHGSAGFFGSQGATVLNKPIVGMAATPDDAGYWLVASDGGVFTHGDAAFFGSTGALHLNKPIVGMAPTPDGKGYWLVASDGGIFAFGDAGFFGSQGATPLNQPIVGMASTPDGLGYWLVASDGGIFTHGDAGFFGSQGATPLNQPIVGMATTPDGLGYWLVASDGGIFTHGDAGFFGSQGATPLNKPIVGMATAPDGLGYWLVASDGGIFTHGDAGFAGSEGGTTLNKPIVGMAG